MAESQPERQPLLGHEDVVVWPIIHMIRGVCAVNVPPFLISNRLLGRTS
jgi:hypothetical protein